MAWQEGGVSRRAVSCAFDASRMDAQAALGVGDGARVQLYPITELYIVSASSLIQL